MLLAFSQKLDLLRDCVKLVSKFGQPYGDWMLTFDEEEGCNESGHDCGYAFDDENPSPPPAVHAVTNANERQRVRKLFYLASGAK